jgi:flagellar basal-body rod protein FlgB
MDKLSIFGPALQNLHQMLDKTTFSQKVLSKNIANAEVPGFQGERPVFEDALNERDLGLRATDEKHITSVKDRAQFKTEKDDTGNPDGTVDMEDTLISLVKTRMNHALTARLATHKIRSLRNSINGHR